MYASFAAQLLKASGDGGASERDRGLYVEGALSRDSPPRYCIFVSLSMRKLFGAVLISITPITKPDPKSPKPKPNPPAQRRINCRLNSVWTLYQKKKNNKNK